MNPCGLCPACGRAGLRVGMTGSDRLHGGSERVEVARCPECGTGATLPRLTEEDLAGLYPEEYGPYEEPNRPAARLVSKAIRSFQARRALAAGVLAPAADRAPGRAVDVGCGRGDLAAALVRRGWEVTGIEPSPVACAHARARGVDARPGTPGTVPLEPASYDLAVFHHSLEHSEDPVRDLGLVATALRPDGVVSVAVPNFACWQARIFGADWYHLDLPRHRSHFTPRGLSFAFRRTGFEGVRLRSRTSSVGLPASLQYRLAGRCLFPSGTALRFASGLCALGYPAAALLDRAGGEADVLYGVARRPAARAATARSISSAIRSAGAG